VSSRTARDTQRNPVSKKRERERERERDKTRYWIIILSIPNYISKGNETAT
jgi:hypothetical protein